MAKTEMAVFTNMCMVTDGQGNVLVQRRTDPGWPGVTFPGGHVEPDETFTDAVIREVREETGLTVIHPVLCGLKQFYTREGARYVVFLYRADAYEGELTSSDEGEAFWIPRTSLKDYPLAPGFADMLPVFEDAAVGEICYLRRGKETEVVLL